MRHTQRPYQIPNPAHRSFAHTNRQTIQQRADLLLELLPATRSIAEICCGDCALQSQLYHAAFDPLTYTGLDLQPEIVAANRARGIECFVGDALDSNALKRFQTYEAIFFGPPLSIECDGHHLLPFRNMVPSHTDFAQVLISGLHYRGTLICICPTTTSLGDAQWLYQQIKQLNVDFNLRLIHYSHSTETGDGSITEPRLKYVELWFSTRLTDQWEVRHSGPIESVKWHSDRAPV